MSLIVLFSDISPLDYSAATPKNEKPIEDEKRSKPETSMLPKTFSIETEDDFSEMNDPSLLQSETSFPVFNLSSSTSMPANEIISRDRVLHVFHDFSCQYCKRFFFEVLKPLKSSRLFLEQGITIRFHAAPIKGEESLALLKAEKCSAEQEKQWDFIEQIYTSTEQSIKKAREIAVGLKMDMDAFENCMESERTTQSISQEKALLKEYGITAIPAILFSDRLYEGIYPPENIEKAIRNDLKITP